MMIQQAVRASALIYAGQTGKWLVFPVEGSYLLLRVCLPCSSLAVSLHQETWHKSQIDRGHNTMVNRKQSPLVTKRSTYQ